MLRSRPLFSIDVNDCDVSHLGIVPYNLHRIYIDIEQHSHHLPNMTHNPYEVPLALAQVLRDKALTEQIDENKELQEDIARLTRVEIRRDCYLSTDMSSYAHGNFNDGIICNEKESCVTSNQKVYGTMRFG